MTRRRTAGDVGFFEGSLIRLSRPFDTFSVAVIFPAVVHALQAIVPDPAGGKLSGAVSAVEANHVGRAGFTPVEGKLFPYHMDRRRLTRPNITGQGYRLPELAQITPAHRTLPRRRKIHKPTRQFVRCRIHSKKFPS